jgi:hypothetical protein
LNEEGDLLIVLVAGVLEFQETGITLYGGEKELLGEGKEVTKVWSSYTTKKKYLFNCAAGSLRLRKLALRHVSSEGGRNSLVVFLSEGGVLGMEEVLLENIGTQVNGGSMILVEQAALVLLKDVRVENVKYGDGGVMSIEKATMEMDEASFYLISRSEGNGSCVNVRVSFTQTVRW